MVKVKVNEIHQNVCIKKYSKQLFMCHVCVGVWVCLSYGAHVKVGGSPCKPWHATQIVRLGSKCPYPLTTLQA